MANIFNRDDDSTTASTSGSGTLNTVVGLFPDTTRAEGAIEALHDAGFTNEQIGIVMQDPKGKQDLGERTGAAATEDSGDGPKKGALSGGILGGLLGLLGSLLIPGVGPIVVAGWLGSTLVGAGIGAAAGGLIGGLISLGVSEHEAQHFEQGIGRGGVLVTINAGERASEAYSILRDRGADLGPNGTEDDAMDSSASTTSAGVAERTMAAGAMSAGGSTADRSMQARRLRLREEQLPVATEGQSHGGTADASEPRGGNERRFKRGESYAGPERRMAATR